MSHKPKFHPVVTRIRLNPEQAVLQCTCFDVDRRILEPLLFPESAPGACRGSGFGKAKLGGYRNEATTAAS